ncbi:MAG: hypothetical protein ACTSRS_19075 [Candidatus Helarchaeota archaeon]
MGQKIKCLTVFLLIFVIFSTTSGIQPSVMANLSDDIPSNLFLTAKPSRIVRQHSTTLDAYLFEEENNIPIANRLITFYIQIDDEWNELGESQTDESGHAILSVFIDLPQDQYLLLATFEGDDSYLPSEDTKRINVIEESMEIHFNPVVQYWGVPTELTAYITNPAGNPIPNRNISFEMYIPGNGWILIPQVTVEMILDPEDPENPQVIWTLQEWTKSNSSGYATVLYSSPPMSGLYDIRISFKGGKYYSIGQRIFYNGLTILKRETTVQGDLDFTFRYGDEQLISFYLFDNLGEPIRELDIDVYGYLPGENGPPEWVHLGTNTSVEDGNFVLEILELFPFGDFPLKIEIAGTSLYTALTAFGTFHVTKELTMIAIEDTVVTYGDLAQISAYLTDDEGNPLQGESLSLSVSYDEGNTWDFVGSSTTDSTGKISVSYTPVQQSGYYLIKGTFMETALYFGTIFITTLVIEEEWTEIEVPIVTGQINDYVDLLAYLMDDEGNPLAGYLISFFVWVSANWEPAGTDTTDSNGLATVNWGPIPTSVVYIKADFAGDPGFYRSSTGEDHIKPQAIPTTLTTSRYWSRESLFIEGYLYAQGTPLQNQLITAYIVNTNYVRMITDYTDSNGKYIIEWSPPDPDHYSISISYSGTGVYAGNTQFLSEAVSWDELIGAWILIGTEASGSGWNGLVAIAITVLSLTVWPAVFFGYGDLWWGAGIATVVTALIAVYYTLWLGWYGFGGIDLGPINLLSWGKNTNEHCYNKVLNFIVGANGLADTGDNVVYKWGLPSSSGNPAWGYDSNHQIVATVDGIIASALDIDIQRAAVIYIGPAELDTSDHIQLKGPNSYKFDLTFYADHYGTADKIYLLYLDSVINPKDRRNAALDYIHSAFFDIDNIMCVGARDGQIPFANIYTMTFFQTQRDKRSMYILDTYIFVHSTIELQMIIYSLWGYASTGFISKIIPYVAALIGKIAAALGGSIGSAAGWMAWAVVGIIMANLMVFIGGNTAAVRNSVYLKIT